jgi:hypothetical protein
VDGGQRLLIYQSRLLFYCSIVRREWTRKIGGWGRCKSIVSGAVRVMVKVKSRKVCLRIYVW